MKKIFLPFLVLFISLLAKAQDNPAYRKAAFIRGTDTLPYRILYPAGYKPSKKYPLLLFLHGAGERGNDNSRQLVHGSALFTDSANRKNFPAIVLFPQCPQNQTWARMQLMRQRMDIGPDFITYATDVPMGISLQLVSDLLDSLAATGSVDKKCIYAGGLSIGGMGTFEILWRKPGFFAAAFPICGGGNTGKAAVYGKNFPIWIFHGADDSVVDVNGSRDMAKALRAAGANVKYSEYPGVGHDSWNNAFAEKELLSWLFSQKKK